MHGANVRNLGRIKSFVHSRLFESRFEIFVVIFLHLSLTLEVLKLRRELRYLLHPLLDVLQSSRKCVSFGFQPR